MAPPRRSRGRPPLKAGEPSYPVHVRMSADDFDAACRAASRDRVSVAELCRRGLQRELHKDDDQK